MAAVAESEGRRNRRGKVGKFWGKPLWKCSVRSGSTKVIKENFDTQIGGGSRGARELGGERKFCDQTLTLVQGKF